MTPPVRRYEVTITYEVDTTKKEGSVMAPFLSEKIQQYVCGGDTNLVTETDFRFREITHPKDSDRVRP
jgi:hypothetical protein